MNILAWIILGLIAGWLASIIAGTNKRQGIVADILFGILGAVVGGFIFNSLGYSAVTGLNIASLLVALVGAVILIMVRKAFFK